MNFDNFIAKWNGKGIDFDGVYGDQCMDLMHQYCVEVLGVTDSRVLVAPAAKDVWNTNVFGKDKFEVIQNTPTGTPQKGDIILFGTEIGQYGHVAIVVSADVNNIVSFDQNWNGHQYCEKIIHTYGGAQGVLGWLRFKGQLPTGEEMVCDPKSVRDMLVIKATQRDDVCTYLSFPIDPSQTDAKKITSTIGGFKSRITDLGNQLASATAEVDNREEQVSRLKQQVLDEQGLKKSLGDSLSEATKKVTDTQGVYEGQLAAKQVVIDQYAKDKGALQIQVSQLTQQLSEARKDAVKGIATVDLLHLIIERFRGRI